jgi:peptidoglycan/LPS O-acetylase OafA/YrhL
MNARNQFWTLEGLRFSASVSIVVFHYSDYFKDLSHRIWVTHLPIAVDLFFVISGVVIANSYAGRISTRSHYLDFLRRRVARLYPLHLLTLIFYVSIGWLALKGMVRVISLEKYDFHELLPNLLMVHAWGFCSHLSFNYVSWSISAEFFAYLLFPIILIVVARDPRYGFVAIVALFFSAAITSKYAFGEPMTSLTFKYSIIRAIPSFALGVYVWSYRSALLKWIGQERVIFLFYTSLLVFALMINVDVSTYALLFGAYLVVSLGLLCEVADKDTFLSWRPISRLGKLTYSVYMLHPILATVIVSFIFPRLFGKSFSVVLTSIVAAGICTFLLAVFSYRYFETPARDAINRFDMRSGRQAPP